MKKHPSGLVLKRVLTNGEFTCIVNPITNNLDDPRVLKYPSTYSWFLGDKKLSLTDAKIYALLNK